MKKNILLTDFIIITITVVALIIVDCFAQGSVQKPLNDKYAAVREALSKAYPNLRYGEINDTEIKGLYEVEVGSNVIYFYPEKTLMVFGEIWTTEGKSLTTERKNQFAAKKLKDIDVSKGIKIGDGKNVVIEFTDPDCPYCRKASEYLKGRKDITLYVFFTPLPMHKDAESKVRFIMCSSDKARTYEEVMNGKYDGQKVGTCENEQVSALIKEHKDIASKIGITATPTFWINGQYVSGANIPIIEQVLNKKI